MSSLKEQLAGLHLTSTEVEPPEPDVSRPIRPSSVPGKRPVASATPITYAAAQPSAKVHLVNFPLRLSTEAIDQLMEWKRHRGITPGLLVREIVEKGIADQRRSFEKEGL